uniref:Chromo domain-containing protein n=1 Tax=Spongospora subterranea TaxID=70186 RepID=A0A0H5R290_9EUKA|eukprot:CRZ08310.1 hypothetical protein [Spongospora subterranea]
MHKKVIAHRQDRRDRLNRKRKAPIPNFSLGDYVLVANTLHKTGSKLSVRWTGPHCITAVISDHIFRVQHLVTKSISDIHAIRLRFYSDASLNITEELLEQVAHDGQGFMIDKLINSRQSGTGIWELLVSWKGFDQLHNSWEPLLHLYQEAPVFLSSELKKGYLASSGDMLFNLEGAAVPGFRRKAV